MILNSAEDSANHSACFQSRAKSMFCNCIYNSYNANVDFIIINGEFKNQTTRLGSEYIFISTSTSTRLVRVH